MMIVINIKKKNYVKVRLLRDCKVMARFSAIAQPSALTQLWHKLKKKKTFLIGRANFPPIFQARVRAIYSLQNNELNRNSL